jgi:hypothetical protein
VAGGKEFEYVALALGEAVGVGAGVFAAWVWIAAAQLGEVLLGAAGRGAGAQPTQGAQYGLGGSTVAAELSDGGVVGATEARPRVGRGLPVPADLKVIGGDLGADDWL